MFKRMVAKLLDYIAYIVLGGLGLIIFNLLYIAWFTESGRAILSIFIFIASIWWAIYRVSTKR